MLLSKLIGTRYKERPAEAVLDSHALLLRGGYIRPVANGIYSLLPPGLRVLRKIEGIVRDEMNRIGCQEVLMPVVLPRDLWDESGRYASVGPELARFSDRTGHGMVLAMTHEEAVVHLCRNEVKSHAQLPFAVFQIQTKFRDEPRSRGGLIRVREFTMKDAYSFHATRHDLDRFYRECYDAYCRIFARVGLPEVVAVAADTGMMGGDAAHEFMLLSDAGEDTVVTSEDGTYRANLDVATGQVEGYPQEPKPLEKVHTPGCKTIEEVAGFLGVPTRQTAKAVFYESDIEGRLVFVVVRGDRDVNEVKLANLIGCPPTPASEDTIRLIGATPGFASPMGVDLAQCRLLIDHTVRQSNNLVTGANEPDYHYKNFNLDRDLPGIATVDLVSIRDGDGSPTGQGKLVLKRGIEVGHIFQLGTTYTEPMKMTYTDESGETRVPLMGCYGIGISRIMACVVEARHDEYGPKWPLSIAPWQVHICALKLGAPRVRDTVERLCADLESARIEVLYDDRDARPGVQFADADLLGIPIRLIISERNLPSGIVEWKRRDTGESGTTALETAVEMTQSWLQRPQ